MDILKKVEEISGELDELRKFIYENPELGFEEYKSSKAHMDLLKKHGFEIECPYMDCPTSFKAIYDSKKREGLFHICQNMTHCQALVMAAVTIF